MFGIKKYLSQLNRRRKEESRYVSRRRYEELAEKYTLLRDAISAGLNPFYVRPPLDWHRAYAKTSNNLCLFVTFSDRPAIKPYVALHVRAFMDKGFDVVLIINTNHPGEPVANLDSVSGVNALCVRDNKGFDFGAWSQVMRELDLREYENIAWVNDSIFGPVKIDAFNLMVDRMLESSADFVGLTSNGLEIEHIQSFFLMFKRRLIADPSFHQYVTNLWQLPTKALVIEFYEIRMTQLIKDLGYRCEALFKLPDRDGHELTYHYPTELIASGFPYVKTALIKSGRDEGMAHRHLPTFLPLE
jgi:rhamnosyltransferase